MSGSSTANGRRWEKYARHECKELKRLDEASASKNWEAPKVPGKHIRIEPSKPDFSGYLPGGRHVIFEAKSTESETSFDFNLLEDHQWEDLDHAHSWGAASFVYVYDGLGRKWVIPWARVLEIEATGKRSFPFKIKDFMKQMIDGPRTGESRRETWLDVWIRLEEQGLT